MVGQRILNPQALVRFQLPGICPSDVTFGKKRNSMRKWTDEKLIEAVKVSNSVCGVLRNIGMSLAGGTHAIIKLRIKQLNLDISHFTGRGWCRGANHKNLIDKYVSIPLEKILVKDSTYQCTTNLKNRLWKLGLLENKCYICGIAEWLGKSISLHLHHIDGDRCNNTLENLTILCPNCHSQTPNFAGNGRKVSKKIKKCICCNKNISKKATRCKSCDAKLQPTKINWPKIDMLRKLVDSKSFSEVGEILGVSGAAVRKKLKTHNG